MALALVLMGSAIPAHAAEPALPSRALSGVERDALKTGHIVSRPVRFQRSPSQTYVGGVSYQVGKASPAEIMSTLLDLQALPEVLPRTKRAKLVENSGARAKVELVQGGGMFEATYTVVLEQNAGRDELRFWLDPSRPHDVKDVWGYFRVRPFGPDHSLLTVAAVLDLGPGIVRMMFEDSIQNLILGSPWNIKKYVEPRAFALQ
ncbi:MAG TPA: SRPBCC family protein [Polyangiaceae bacterium]|nr:SRPBCC family protein [Polyangiaceae bacterium]